MSGPVPHKLLAKAAARGAIKKSAFSYPKHAKIAADALREVAMRVEAGEITKAQSASHRAHALIEILAELQAQNKHAELRDDKCAEKRRAFDEWNALIKPNAATQAKLAEHFERRHFAFLTTASAPAWVDPPKPKRESYKGKIYETVFLPENPAQARRAKLPDDLKIRHGVTNRGFTSGVYEALNRKFPLRQKNGVGYSVFVHTRHYEHLAEPMEVYLRVKPDATKIGVYPKALAYRIASTTYEAPKPVAIESPMAHVLEKPSVKGKKSVKRKAVRSAAK